MKIREERLPGSDGMTLGDLIKFVQLCEKMDMPRYALIRVRTGRGSFNSDGPFIKAITADASGRQDDMGRGL